MTSPNRDKENKPAKKAAGVTVKHQARRVKISRPGDNRYAPKTDRGDSSAPKPSKKIEVVIHKMIDICLYLGHIPYELYLSEEDYSKLIEETMAYEPSGMKIIDNGIEYRKEKVPLEITNYCGVPVYRSAKNRTSLLWR